MNAGEPDSANYQRLRAPAEDGGTLIVPPLERVGELIAANMALREGATVLDRRWSDLARQARGELIHAARAATAQYRDVPDWNGQGPVLLAGHQPQLFHAGVWFKNFVLGRLAAGQGGVGINLVIDSDTLRSPSIRVPGGSVAQPTAQAIPFDLAGPEIPFEERAILDRALFESFSQRVQDQLRPLVKDPLIADYWPLVIQRSRAAANLGESLAQARHVLEGAWGLWTLELPQSQVCQLPSFCLFAAHLLMELPRLREVYNRSLLEYRRMHRVRSKNHPAPELTTEEDWQEAPFWIWSRDDPRRRRLFVRRLNDRLLLTDRRNLQLEVPLRDGDPQPAAEMLAGLPARQIKLRTRALITTLWARLALGDLFLHGIGGAKYDLLTDLILKRFFHVDPPGFLAVTATLRLPVPHKRSSPETLEQIDQQLRDLEFHPERWLEREPDAVPPVDRARVRELVQTKRRWIETPQSRANARQRCHAIRQANAALAQWTAGLRDQLQRRRGEVQSLRRSAAVLESREYAFCLFPAETLRNFYWNFARSNRTLGQLDGPPQDRRRDSSL